MILWIALAAAVVIGAAAAVINRKLDGDPAIRRAGKRGEQAATYTIRVVLKEGDRLFTNVRVRAEGKRAELDNVVVNKNGVFIIEVKNYSGKLTGGTGDYEWKKIKKTGSGKTYKTMVKNPFRQVKRQVYLLSRYLKKHNCKAWARGYVLLVNDNSPVKNPYVLTGTTDIDRAIHTPGKTHLSRKQVDEISGYLRKASGKEQKKKSELYG